MVSKRNTPVTDKRKNIQTSADGRSKQYAGRRLTTRLATKLDKPKAAK